MQVCVWYVTSMQVCMACMCALACMCLSACVCKHIDVQVYDNVYKEAWTIQGTITTTHQIMIQQGLLLFWVPFIVAFVFRNFLNVGSTHFKNIHSSMGALSCTFQCLFITLCTYMYVQQDYVFGHIGLTSVMF